MLSILPKPTCFPAKIDVLVRDVVGKSSRKKRKVEKFEVRKFSFKLECTNRKWKVFIAVLTPPTSENKDRNSEKSIFEIRIPNFCYIQVIVFDLSYLLVAAVVSCKLQYMNGSKSSFYMNLSGIS